MYVLNNYILGTSEAETFAADHTFSAFADNRLVGFDIDGDDGRSIISQRDSRVVRVSTLLTVRGI